MRHPRKAGEGRREGWGAIDGLWRPLGIFSHEVNIQLVRFSVLIGQRRSQARRHPVSPFSPGDRTGTVGATYHCVCIVLSVNVRDVSFVHSLKHPVAGVRCSTTEENHCAMPPAGTTTGSMTVARSLCGTLRPGQSDHARARYPNRARTGEGKSTRCKPVRLPGMTGEARRGGTGAVDCQPR